MKKSLTIVMIVLLVFIAVACTPETHTTHNWDAGKQTLAPTCESAGEWTYTCTVCGITKTDPIEAKGHTKPDWTKWSVVSDENDAPDLQVNEVTCYTDGIYEYRCTDCGKVGTVVVTPKMAKELGMKGVKHVTKVNGKYVPVLKDGAINTDRGVTEESAVRYYNDKTVAATMFTPVSKIAYCATCGDELGALNEVVSTGTTPTYEKIVGTFVAKTLTDKKVTEISYYDVVESEKGLTVKSVISAYSQGKWTTSEADPVVASFVIREDSEVEGKSVRSLKLNDESYLSEDSAGNLVYSENGKEYTKPDEDKCTIKFISEHNHKFDTNKKDGTNANENYIGNDSCFQKVEFLGEDLMNSEYHYLYCEKCGINYYPVAHDKDASDEKSCSVCGYNSSDYVRVDVNGYDVENARAVAVTVSQKSTEAGSADTNNGKLSGSTETKYGDSVTYAVTASDAAYYAKQLISDTSALEASDEKKLQAVARALSEAIKSTTAEAFATAVKGTTANVGEAYGTGASVLGSSVKSLNDETIKTKYEALYAAATGTTGGEVSSCHETIYSLSKEISSKASELAIASSGTATNTKNNAEKNAVLTDSFVVKTKTVLGLGSNYYTSVYGVEYTFMKNSSWSNDDSDTIVWNGTGYTVMKAGSLKFYGKVSN